jgi:hypothetical protein
MSQLYKTEEICTTKARVSSHGVNKIDATLRVHQSNKWKCITCKKEAGEM